MIDFNVRIYNKPTITVANIFSTRQPIAQQNISRVLKKIWNRERFLSTNHLISCTISITSSFYSKYSPERILGKTIFSSDCFSPPFYELTHRLVCDSSWFKIASFFLLLATIFLTHFCYFVVFTINSMCSSQQVLTSAKAKLNLKLISASCFKVLAQSLFVDNMKITFCYRRKNQNLKYW